MRILRAFLTTGILFTLASCDPASSAITAPEQAVYDNGSGFGSGHRTLSDTTSSATAVPTSTAGTADDTTTTERGGSGFGSGH